MKFFKLNWALNKEFKKYIPYALGELFLIVFGILLALTINNWNSGNQYKKEVDNNFQRVFFELEKNIAQAQETIEQIQQKDSLIYLVMNDSIQAEDYYKDINLAYLTLYYYNLNLEDKAYQNLIKLNVSDNKYQNELITELKELYLINDNIKQANDRMSSFVYEECLPSLARNTESFGDLTYKSQVKKDAVDFFINSNKYKSTVSQYAIIAIKNQLRHNQVFLKKAYDIYSKINQEYLLTQDSLYSIDYAMYTGNYVGTRKDTFAVTLSNDSLFITKPNFKLGLIPIQKDHFFTGNDTGGYFVTFTESDSNRLNMRIHLLSNRLEYQRVEE